jgi:peptidoglycan/xylan/chitin deacetylase (PgdA/CDA1 family)
MLRTLAYHRVAEWKATSSVDDRSLSATPSVFAAQMQHLVRHYRVVALSDVLEAIQRRAPLPERSVLITFDDAYSDFAEIAWPILKRLRLPATLFVPTAYPDHAERAFWWDRLYDAFRKTSHKDLEETPLGPLSLARGDQRQRSLQLLQDHLTRMAHDEAMLWVESICSQLHARTSGGRVLSWESLRELSRDGVTLGAHSRSHAIMTRLTPERMREEVRGSLEDLRRETGTALPVFCYPNGNYNDTVVSILRDEGILLAFTTCPETHALDSADPLRLGRTSITPRTSLPIFALRLLRPGSYLDAWRHRKLKRVLTEETMPPLYSHSGAA